MGRRRARVGLAVLVAAHDVDFIAEAGLQAAHVVGPDQRELGAGPRRLADVALFDESGAGGRGRADEADEPVDLRAPAAVVVVGVVGPPLVVVIVDGRVADRGERLVLRRLGLAPRVARVHPRHPVVVVEGERRAGRRRGGIALVELALAGRRALEHLVAQGADRAARLPRAVHAAHRRLGDRRVEPRREPPAPRRLGGDLALGELNRASGTSNQKGSEEHEVRSRHVDAAPALGADGWSRLPSRAPRTPPTRERCPGSADGAGWTRRKAEWRS